MDRIYIVTGANGHLGGTIVRMLHRSGAPRCGGWCCPPRRRRTHGETSRYFTGDVLRDKATLSPLFADTGRARTWW